MQNPINDVIQGMMQGALMGNMLRRAGVEQRMLQEQRAQVERDNEDRDIQTRIKLAGISRPVGADGTVEDRFEMPGLGVPVPIQRKAKNTVNFRGERFELKSPEEQASAQLQQELARARGLGGVEDTLALDKVRRLAAEGETPRTRDEASRIAQEKRDAAAQAAQAKRDAEAQRFTANQNKLNRDLTIEQNAANRAHQEKIQSQGIVAADKRSDRLGARAEARQEERAAAQEQKQATAAEAAKNRTGEMLQRQHDSLDREGQKAHAAVNAIVSLENSPGWRKLTEPQRATKLKEKREKKDLAEQLERRKREVLQRKSEIYQSGGGTPSAESLFSSYLPSGTSSDR